MTDENLPANQPPEGQFLLYQTEDGETRIECRLVSETIWLTQRLMSDLFQVTVATINEHLKNLANDGEIDANRTCLLYTSPSPRDRQKSRMPSSA